MPRVFLLVVAVFAVSCSRRAVVDPLPGFPKLVLWAWERPENLMFITPTSTGVAYLAATITVDAGGARYEPRMQPLWIRDGTPLIAVVRIELLNAGSLRGVAAQVLTAVQGRAIRAVQIDFDARFSERRYYNDFMEELRRKLPATLALEMTALVSWCQKDDWIGTLPVVEAVPMFFRMGADPHAMREPLQEPLCAASVGISTDEFPAFLPGGKRVFVFNDKPWTEETYRAVLRKLKR